MRSISHRVAVRRFSLHRGVVPVIVALAAAATTMPAARADLLAGWDFQTTTNGGVQISGTPNTQRVLPANFGSGTLYLDGSNFSSVWSQTSELAAFSGTPINAGVGFSTVTTSPAALALVNSSANGKYAVFKFDMTGWQDLAVSYAAQRTNSGFTSILWEASTDGAAWTSVGSIASGSSFATSGILSLPTISLLNNSPTAYLRLSGTGASSTTGNNRFDNFQFNVTTYAPPSGTSTWTGNGAGGTWSNGTQGHFAAPYANSLTAAVIFTGTGESVTVGSGVEAGTLNFQPSTGNYSLGGGSLALGIGVNATVAASSTASITTPISGTAGLSKAGGGTLALGGANSFTGPISISQGTVQIAADGNLGDVANDITLVGTLKTTASVALDSGRDISGSGTLDIAPGTTLAVGGGVTLTSLALPGGGTLNLQGPSRTLGNVTFGTAAQLDAASTVSMGGIAATAVTSGTVLITPVISFTSGDKPVDVGAGGTVVLAGDIAGTTGRLAKTGAGTLRINGGNSTGGLRIGASGSTPTDGGTVILATDNSVGSLQLQFNYGTLKTENPGGLNFAVGVSIGGRANGVPVFGGTAPLTFTGSSSFFRGANTSGDLRIDANNTTTISGTLGPTSGSGTASGITIGGTGRLILAATGVGTSGSTSFTDRVAVNSGATLEIANENALAYAPLSTSGGGTITFSVPSVTVATVQGTGTLSLRQVSNAPVALTLSQTTSGTYTGGFSGPGSLVKNGTASTLTLAGVSTLTGSTTVQQGTLQLANAAALGSSRLVPLAGGTVTLTQALQTTVGGLAPAAGGLVNVGTGLVNVSSGLSASNLVAAIMTGMGDGSWNGTSGITSTAAATSGGDRTIGWLDNGDGSVTFAFAAPGDTNLDWMVDSLDQANFLAGGKLDTGLPATWVEGDFTYDGFVDILDAAAFTSTGLFDKGSYNTPPATVAAVPEPSSAAAGLLIAAATMLLRRRPRPTLTR